MVASKIDVFFLDFMKLKNSLAMNVFTYSSNQNGRSTGRLVKLSPLLAMYPTWQSSFDGYVRVSQSKLVMVMPTNTFPKNMESERLCANTERLVKNCRKWTSKNGRLIATITKIHL
jgi:hypothetical protein